MVHLGNESGTKKENAVKVELVKIDQLANHPASALTPRQLNKVSRFMSRRGKLIELQEELDGLSERRATLEKSISDMEDELQEMMKEKYSIAI